MQKQLLKASSRLWTGMARPLKQLKGSKLLLAGFLTAGSLWATEAQAQTTVLSEGFETGGTNWTMVNGTQVNKWFIGAAATPATGTNSAYIDNGTGATNVYTLTTTSVTHIYTDVTFPANETAITLTFKWKAQGEGTPGSTDYDNLKVFAAAAGATVTAGTAMAAADQVGAVYYNFSAGTGYTTATVQLPASFAGTTKRLVFSWKNDGSGGTQPPVSIDDILITSRAAAPISGTFTINNTLPTSGTNFASFTDAINSLNLNGINGPVTFNVSAGQTFNELPPALTATGTATNTITFQKSGTGNNPLISATAGIGVLDGIIILVGSDYVTFDGINLEDPAANTTSNTRMEWGYALLRGSNTNGSQNVTIKNATITLQKANTASIGIFSGPNTLTSSSSVSATGATADGTNSNNKFFSNTISNVYTGIRLEGISTAAVYDVNNQIGVGGANTISNYGGGSSTTYGIYSIYQEGEKIANNSISGGTGSTSTFYGIFTSTATNANLEIYNNNLNLTSSSTTSSMYGINNAAGGTGTNNLVKIYGNTIQMSFPAATSGSMYMIYNTATAFNIDIYNNTINNISRIGTGSTYVLYQSASVVSGANIYNNTISGVTSTAASPLYLVYSSPTTTTNTAIYGNTISGTSTTSGTLNGIYVTAGGVTNVYKNNIFNLSSSSTSATVYGVYTSGGTTNNIYNNFISEIKTPASTSTDAIRAIYASSGTTGIYYNTIYLNATSSSTTTFGTSGVYASTTPTVELRNNIIVNVSTPGATGGVTAAYRRSSTTLTTYAAGSNTNLFYAGTPSANQVIFTDGTNLDQTLGAYKTRVSPRDANSVTGLPPFLNITTSPYNLHINPAIATQVEGTATPVTTPVAITTDFDGNTRSTTAPDMGADEGTFIPQDLTPPTIVYTPLTNTLNTTGDRTFNATISDASGVYITGNLIPRIYYRKNNGTYISKPGTFVSGTTASSTWTFTILGADLGTLVPGDVISYYVIAQDMANPDIVGSSPSGVVATDVNTVTTHPAAPNTYLIQTPFTGTFNVGTGQTITSLTNTGGLFDVLNNNALGGNLTVNITSDLTSETGAIALNQWIETGAGSYTLTIQPSAAANRTISGSFAGGLIRLNGADRVTIDGNFSGAGRFLTFANTNSTASNTAAIQVISLGTGLGAVNNTIKNTNIAGGSNTVTSAFGIYAGEATISTSGTGAANNNLTIQNNLITNAYIAVFARGVASTGLLTGLNISNNTIGSNTAAEYVTFRGVDIQNATAPVISENTIFNLKQATSVNNAGIEIGQNSADAMITRNRIFGIYSTSASGYGAYGINIASGTGNSNITIANNMISDIITSNYSTTSTQWNPFGIRITGGTNLKIYYNSINLFGAPTTGTSASMSAPIIVTSSSATGLDIRNNIFANTMTGLAGTKTYGFYAVSGTTFGNIDNNDYYAPIVGYLGADKVNLTEWQGATTKDANSKNVNPEFVSNTDLHTSAFDLNGAGTPIAGLTNDFDGDTRNATTPDIGADEFNLAAVDLSPITLNAPAVKSCYTATEPVSVTVRNLGSSPINFTTNPLTITAAVSGAATQTFAPVTVNTNTLNGGNPLASGASVTVPIGTANMSATGTYTFTATTALTGDLKASNDVMAPVTRTLTALSAGTAAAGQNVFCQSGTPTLTITGSTGGDIQWQQGTSATGPFTNIAGANGTTFTPAAALTQTTYYQAVASCGTNNATTNVVTVTVNTPQVTIPPVALCGPGTANLTATPSAGANVTWFDAATGGTQLATGNTYSPNVTTTTTFYAQAATGTPEKAGKMSTTGADGTNTSGGLIFNATAPFVLDSVVVYSAITAGGPLTVNLTNAAGTVLQTATVTLPPVTARTAIVVPLNFNVPAGTGLKLIQGTSLALSRDYTASAGIAYPYNSPSGLVTITDGTLAGYYYFFYRWSISSSCLAPTRTPVVVTVNSPAATPTITAAGGSTTICAGSSVVLTAASATTGATYQWLLNGTAIASATNATFSANAAGSYTVIATANGCASAASTATTVTVTPLPATPTITQNGGTLISSSATGNQWFLNGVAIPGATGATYITTANGNYTVVVTANGCASATSAVKNVTNTSVKDALAGMSVDVYPNPATGSFNVKLNGYQKDATVILYNLAGQKIATDKVSADGNAKNISLKGLAAGTYLLKVTSEKGTQVNRLIVQ